MKEITEIFKRVEKKLLAQKWFKSEKWQVSTHPFPEKNPDGVTFHISKKNWFNEDHHGIHIESFLYSDPKKRKKSYITVHLFHHDKIPNTNIKRIAFSKPLIDEIYSEVARWKEYKFRAGKYGQQPFSKDLDGNNKEFENILTEEAARMCQLLGPAIDRWLKETLG